MRRRTRPQERRFFGISADAVKTERKVLGPDSILWQALADWRILLCSGRSLLLQVAHPAVAAGVAQHSNFADDPWKRLRETVELYFGGVIFGWPDGSAKAAAHLRAMHERIAGLDAAGRPYHALDPSVFHWVHATLVDGTAVLLEHFGKALAADDFDRLYTEMRYIGQLCGLRNRDMPRDWPGFRRYFDYMVRSELEDNATVRAVLATLSHPPRPPVLPIPDSLWCASVWPVRHLVMLCTVGLLPAALRERLGLPWSLTQEMELRVHAAFIRRLVPLLPARLRMPPYAYAAFRHARFPIAQCLPGST